MAKTVKSLTGKAKDDYLARVAGELGLNPDERERLAERLQRELSRVWVRLEAIGDDQPAAGDGGQDAREQAGPVDGSEVILAAGDSFDPFTPNVIVVLRTAGREKLLAELRDIAACENLRRLAREQQLGVEADVTGAEALRQAIIAAAERRIANRRAAAS